MRKKGYRLQVIGYSKKIVNILLALLITTTYNLPPLGGKLGLQPTTSYAQTSPSQTKKNVVKNFKINLSEYSSFGTNCDKKPQGDANCDGIINGFDLSIWEVEFNSNNPPKKADFNNDGAVTIVDYGIWRNTTYPQPSRSLSSLILNLKSLIFKSVLAQESSSGGGEVNSSSAFTSESGNLVINTLNGGNSQQVNFDQNGNPQTSTFYNGNGDSYAEVAFTSSGDTIIATQESGIPVTISKTASGPIIENFKNPDGSPLAIKSWPSQESYDSNQPPLAVTIPGQGATKEVLNMQPNGDGIVEKIDAAGNIMTRTQLRSNGTIVTQDLVNNMSVQSNTEVKFTTLSMKNNIGGDTEYMFYDGALYAIIQTDGGTNAYIAKPTDSSGASWTYETLVEGVKRGEKTVSDPITEAKSNSPNPQALIQNINYYKQASLPSDSVTFSEGFTSTAPGIANPVNRANAILAISKAQTPAVLGLSIVKEAKAQQGSGWNEISRNPETQNSGDDKWSQTVTQVVYQQARVDDQGRTLEPNEAVVTTVAPTNPDLRGPNDPQGHTTISTTVFTATGEKVQETKQIDGVFSQPAAPADIPSFLGANGLQAPAAAQQPANPAPPAPPGPAGAPPPGPGLGMNESATALDAGAKAAQAAGERGESPAQQAKAGYDAAYAKTQEFSGFGQEKAQNLANDVFSHSFLSASLKNAGVDDADIQGKTGTQLASMAQARGIDVAPAINAARSDQGLAPVSSPFSAQSGQSAPPGPASAPAAAAAAASSIPAVGASMSFGNGMTSTITAHTAEGGFTSTITNAAGDVVATQTTAPGGVSTWNDAVTGETYTAQSGTLTAATIDVSAVGSIVGVDANGNLMAVGDSSFINSSGYVEGGRPATQQEIDAWNEQAREQLGATGVDQYGFDSGTGSGYTMNSAGSHLGNPGSCFLAGTPISTPNGPIEIQTLKPGDKVYSYNEQTKQKQIADFKKLDINFVDEYLIINGNINTTVYHPFYMVDDNRLKTIRADKLKLGNILQNEAGKYVPVYSIERIQKPKTTVYNLTNVAPNNNFYAEGILVHNYADGSEYDSASLSVTGGNDDWGGGGSGYSGDTGITSDSTPDSVSSNDSFNNDTSNGSDANSSGSDSSGW